VSYQELNPQGRVPTLEEHGKLIGPSLAICEYLEETHPNPPVLPRGSGGARGSGRWLSGSYAKFIRS
jgi:glutathione S-transferase